ncbi:hypothetical protein [Candidatus Chordibacter forsetii]|uniref:hypothetical protein n=1 Tax=Candidatus Chordibacter forsetii TaxID=3381758 RepID=UPI00389AF66A
MPEQISAGERIHYLKIILTILVSAGSTYLILLSYLPKVSLQIRSLSFAISIHLLAFLGLFWFCLIEGNEVIDKQERLAIFVFTAVTYLTGIFSLWYALRPKRKFVQDFVASKIPNSLPKASETKKKTSAPNELDSDVIEEKESESTSKDQTIESSEDAGKKELGNEENLEDNTLEKAVEAVDESGEQIEQDTDVEVNSEQTNEEAPQNLEESSVSVQAPSSNEEENMLSNESEMVGEDVDQVEDSNATEPSSPNTNESEEPKAV